MGWNIPLVNSGQVSRLCALPTSCPCQTYLLGGQAGGGKGRGEGRNLSAVQPVLSNSQGAGVLSIKFQSQMQNTAP